MLQKTYKRIENLDFIFRPVVISKAKKNESIQVYGNGQNIRDWLFMEDHIEAILTIAFRGLVGSTYFLGGCNEYTNLEIANLICNYLNDFAP
jgi:dTDP-glucose 4,6-dehydratase